MHVRALYTTELGWRRREGGGEKSSNENSSARRRILLLGEEKMREFYIEGVGEKLAFYPHNINNEQADHALKSDGKILTLNTLGKIFSQQTRLVPMLTPISLACLWRELHQREKLCAVIEVINRHESTFITRSKEPSTLFCGFPRARG